MTRQERREQIVHCSVAGVYFVGFGTHQWDWSYLLIGCGYLLLAFCHERHNKERKSERQPPDDESPERKT